jgi:hypothetical protein
LLGCGEIDHAFSEVRGRKGGACTRLVALL